HTHPLLPHLRNQVLKLRVPDRLPAEVARRRHVLRDIIDKQTLATRAPGERVSVLEELRVRLAGPGLRRDRDRVEVIEQVAKRLTEVGVVGRVRIAGHDQPVAVPLEPRDEFLYRRVPPEDVAERSDEFVVCTAQPAEAAARAEQLGCRYL